MILSQISVNLLMISVWLNINLSSIPLTGVVVCWWLYNSWFLRMYSWLMLNSLREERISEWMSCSFSSDLFINVCFRASLLFSCYSRVLLCSYTRLQLLTTSKCIFCMRSDKRSSMGFRSTLELSLNSWMLGSLNSRTL